MDAATPAAAAMPELLDARRAYRQDARRRLALIGAMAAALLACLVTDLSIGPGRYGWDEILRALLGMEVHRSVQVVIWEIRLPVALMAVVVGASLSVAGAQMQTVLDNPLASPFTLGISAAAAFGAALGLVLGVSLLPAGWAAWTVPGNAFLAAGGAALLIHLLSLRRGATAETVVLLGIALVFTFNAMLSALEFLATEQALQAVVFWTMGSLQRATWDKLAITAAVLALVWPLFARQAWSLTALRLGERRAEALGVNVARLRLTTILLVSLLAAVSVAFVGVIGFVGIVGPHVARMLVGEDQRTFLPASALCGALMLSAASLLSKTVMTGVILPIGIVTALAGVPFFFVLILRSTRRARAW